MREKTQILIIYIKVSLLLTLGCLILALAFRVSDTRRWQEILGVMIAFLPSGIGTWLVFRQVKAHLTRLESMAASVTFALSAPVSLLVGALVAQIPGAYAGFWGRPFGLAGALAGILIVVTLGTYLPSMAVIWVTRRLTKARQ